jgi:hypothetical protein
MARADRARSSDAARGDRAAVRQPAAPFAARLLLEHETSSQKVLPCPSSLSTPISPVEKLRQLAADRETETRAAVLAAHAAVELREALEDLGLAVLRDADACVGDRQANGGVACQSRSAAWRRAVISPLIGELDGVADQIGEHLAEAAGVGAQLDRESRPAPST